MKLNEVREEMAEATRRRQEAVNRYEQLQGRMVGKRLDMLNLVLHMNE